MDSNDRQYEVINSYQFFVGNHYKAGWPIVVGKIADLNIFRDDTGKEKILAYDIDGRLSLLNGDGTIVPGKWPINISTLYPSATRFYSAQPSIGDIEGDGRNEIVWAVSVYSDTLGWKTDILVFGGDGNLKGGTGSAPHTISSNSRVRTGIVLSDINKDGKLEMILIELDFGSGGSKLWVLDYQGNLFSSNWPKVLEIPAENMLIGTNLFPAVGDFDGNAASSEIVAGTLEFLKNPPGPYYNEGSLFAFDIFGNHLPGWPVHSNQTSLIATFNGIGPVLADIDNNGTSEVYIDGAVCSMSSFMFDSNGQQHSGWPLYEYHFNYNPNAFADLDGDGKTEAIASGIETEPVDCNPVCKDILKLAIYARRGDGSNFTANWPKILTLKDYCLLNLWGIGALLASGPLVVDVDGDNQSDIIAQAYNRIFIFKKDGTLLTGPYELYTENYCQNFNAPAIGDIDSDGLSELIATDYSGKIYAWDLPAAYNKRNTAWPLLQHDPQHTGYYTVPPPVPAKITAPLQSQVLSTKTVTFQWDKGLDAKRYRLVVGTAPAIGNIYSGEQLTNSPVAVSNIPLRGAPIYVTLGSLIYDKYVDQYYTYQTKNLEGGLGYLTSPKEGQALGNSTVTFSWSAAPNGEFYTLSVGTSMDNWDICYSRIVEGLSSIVTGIPITGKPIYVRLGTKLIGDPYVVNMFYTFKTDKTPATTPVVTDGGAYQSNTTTLTANWASSDPESGITEYQYQITQDSGTGTAVTVIRNWTSTGTTASVTATGLALLQGKTYYFNVKAKNGVALWSAVGYSNGIKVDTTAPIKPVVTDEGATTISITTLKASWTSSDVESGIAQYQYRITQDSTIGTEIKPWTSTGTTPSVTAANLTLVRGKKYYFGVKSKNGAGTWSAIGYSDGILVQ